MNISLGYTLFGVVITWRLNEAASTTVMSSGAPSMAASMFEMPYLTDKILKHKLKIKSNC